MTHNHCQAISTIHSGGCLGSEVEIVTIAYGQRNGGRSADHDFSITQALASQHFRCNVQADERRNVLELEVQVTFRNLVHGIAKGTDSSIVIVETTVRRQFDDLITFANSLCSRVTSINFVSFNVLQGFTHRSKFGCSSMLIECSTIHQIALGGSEEGNLVTILPKALGVLTLVVQHHTGVCTYTSGNAHFLLITTRNDGFFFGTACKA